MNSVIQLPDVVGDVGIFIDGDWVESKDQDPNGDVRLIQLADVGDGVYIDKSSRFLTMAKAQELRCTFLKPGDILLARMPDPLGRACIFPGSVMPCVTVVDVCIIRPDPKIADRRWLLHRINSPEFRSKISQYTSGTTRQRISRGNLGKIELELPPLAEQRRIAAILDKADALRQQRRAALDKLDTLLQSIFLDMFGDPVTNPMGWEVKELGELVNITTGKLDSNAAIEGGAYPFFTCAKEISRIDRFAFDCEALLLAGNNANADYDVKLYKGKFNAYQRTYVLTLKDNSVSYPYMKMALEAKLADLKRLSRGTNTRYLTLTILNPLILQVPLIEVMEAFDQSFAEVMRQKERMNFWLARADNLFHALQQRAFRGEL